VANRYLKITDQNTGRPYYVEYRSGAALDNRSYYAEASYLHISASNYCFEPGLTVAVEADGLPGANGGSSGNAGPGWPDIAVMAENTKTNYDAFNSAQCYHAWSNGDVIMTGTFRVHTYNKTTSGLSVKIEPLNNPFKDISNEHPDFKSGIAWMYRNGIAAGNSSYSPGQNVTRGQMAAFIYRAAGKPSFTPTAADLARFSDINNEHPDFKKAIMWMASNGITNGYGNGKFGPSDQVTRGQMAAFIYRADANVNHHIYY
jgi:hypothetical protein